jgi:hypothetical protein
VLGQADRRAGDWDAALEHFRLGTEAAKAGGAEGFATEIEIHAAMTLARSGDIAASKELIAGVADRAKPYPVLRAWARLFQSWISFADDRERSREIAEEVLRESRSDAADPWVTAVAHQHLGIADLLDGEVEAGKAHLRLSLLGFLDIANRSDIALTLLAVAAMLNRDGNRDAARGVLASALAWGTRAMLGGFEETMYDEIGPLPDEPADEPMPSHAILALLGASDDIVARPATNRFVRAGDLWEVSFAGRDAVLPNSKGMADLARLISSPGTEIAALDLMGSALSSGSAGEASDETARREYRARLAELQRDIDDAESANDPYRAESARAEMDELIDHLGSMFGIGGRPRPEKDAAERARSAVTARIRATIKKIGEVHEPLADHLDLSVSTGRFCRYAPAEPPEWEV